MSGGDSMAHEPLYRRVQLDLASQILAGAWSPGQFLPTEQALQERYRVSRTTIRKAVAELVASGLLVIERGNGTRVAEPLPEPPTSGLLSFSRTMRELGRQPGIARAVVRLDPAPPGSDLGDGPMVHLTRVHTADGEPVSLSESWLPPRLFAGIALGRLSEQPSLYDELQALDLGVVEVIDTFGLTNASADEADALRVQPGVPLLLVDRVGYAANHVPIENSRIVVCAERYRPTVITGRRP